MTSAFAYVAWTNGSTYRIDEYVLSSLSASGVTRVNEAQISAREVQQASDGTLSFSFFRPLAGSNIAPSIDTQAFPLVWALGDTWHLSPFDSDTHFLHSGKATIVNLLSGSATSSSPPPSSLLIAHGILMTAAFGFLLIFTGLIPRYTRKALWPTSPSAWFLAHQVSAASTIIVGLAGVGLALAYQVQLYGNHLSSISLKSHPNQPNHSTWGVVAIVLLCFQPINAMLRPEPRPSPLPPTPTRSGILRLAWEIFHRINAICTLGFGFYALYTGLNLSEIIGNVQNTNNLEWGLLTWISAVVVLVVVREAINFVFRSRVEKPPVQEEERRERGAEEVDNEGIRLEETGGAKKWTASPRERWLLVASLAWLALALLLGILVATGQFPGLEASSNDVMSAGNISLSDISKQPSPPFPPSPSLYPQNPFPPPRPPSPPFSLVNCSIASIPAQRAKLGNGFCDSGAPFNTLECGFDLGDCCSNQSAIIDCMDPSSDNFMQQSAKGWQVTGSNLSAAIPQNPRYLPSVSPSNLLTLTTPSVAQSYNNFYEFSFGKGVNSVVSPASIQLMTLSVPVTPWPIVIDGLVAAPRTVDLRQLLSEISLEQRTLRHRCVETWAQEMTWTGFPLRKLLSLVQPTADAKYVRFESYADARAMPLVKSNPKGEFPGVPWPYVEGLTVDEALNDLAFLAVGQYGAPLVVQSGAPIRLLVPWKYGFKSAKSVTRISFVSQRPVNWWQAINPSEYGFWANVNPAWPHPRWSQAYESALVNQLSGTRYPTLIFNGYGPEVSYLYNSSINGTREYWY